jgi:serine/threonine-protein kinase RsbW
MPAEHPPTDVSHRFPRRRRSVGRAREALKAQLAAWHVAGEPADIAELLLSELVTNAVQAPTPPGREIGVRFALTPDTLRVEASDTSDRQPTPRLAEVDDERGRGLALVEALSDDWGVRPRAVVGKTVWAILKLQTDGNRPAFPPLTPPPHVPYLPVHQ